MKSGDYVEIPLPAQSGLQLAPQLGWIVATEGDWAVVRISSMRPPLCPFASFHRSQLNLVPGKAVQRGAAMIG